MALPRGGSRRLWQLLVVLLLALMASACKPAGEEERIRAILTPPVVGQDRTVQGGDPSRGAAIIRTFGCGACHIVPGVTGASGMVGPPLSNWAQRGMLAGRVPNTPANLVLWLQDPQAIEPGTAMPDLGVDEQQARDMAAYLYTLR